MKEKAIEEYLRRQVKLVGGYAYKFESPGNAGVPDRLCLFPGGKIYFVEMKAAGKKPRPSQMAQLRRIESLGNRVRIIDSKDGVDELIAEYLESRS